MRPEGSSCGLSILLHQPDHLHVVHAGYRSHKKFIKRLCNRVRGLHMAPHLVPPFLLDLVHFVAIRACCPARHAKDAGHDSLGEKDRTSTLASSYHEIFHPRGEKSRALVCCLAFSSVCQFSSVRSSQCCTVTYSCFLTYGFIHIGECVLGNFYYVFSKCVCIHAGCK